MANSTIAGMLAQSGLAQGKAIGAPIQAFGQTMGQQLSEGLMQRRQAKEIEEARKIVDQYTTGSGINPGMLSKKAQEADAEDKDYLATIFREGAELANTNMATGQNLAGYNQLAVAAGLSSESISSGILGILAGQYKDPGSALKGAMDTQTLVEKGAKRKNAAEQLRVMGSDDLADDVESGMYTDAQVGNVLLTARQAAAAAEQGQEGLEAFVTASDLSDTAFGQAVVAGQLKDVPPTLVSKLATEALAQREEDAFIENARKLNRPEATEAAELLELGVITITGAKNLIKDGGKTEIQTADMDQYVLEGGKPVWGGDITVNGVERRAYQDPNDPTQITSLPADATKLVTTSDKKEGRVNITKTELTLGSISLIGDDGYSDLDSENKLKAQAFWAAVYLDLIREEDVTKEQAEARARERTLARIKDGEFQQTEVTEDVPEGTPTFDTEAEALASGLEEGTLVIINGRRARL